MVLPVYLGLIILGTLSSSSVADDDLVLEGSVDLSGITFSNIDDIRLDDGSGTRQTIGANASTSLGLTEIETLLADRVRRRIVLITRATSSRVTEPRCRPRMTSR